MNLNINGNMKGYVYIITNLDSNKKYVGSRMYEGNPVDDKKYMGSSLYLREIRGHMCEEQKQRIKESCKKNYKNKLI
jgi:hypothetical protein